MCVVSTCSCLYVFIKQNLIFDTQTCFENSKNNLGFNSVSKIDIMFLLSCWQWQLSTFVRTSLISLFTEPEVSGTHPAILWVMSEPSHHSLQHMLFISHIQFFHGEHLAEPVWGQLPELLSQSHITKMCLQVLSGNIMDVIKAVVQREEPDANAVLCSDAAL